MLAPPLHSSFSSIIRACRLQNMPRGKSGKLSLTKGLEERMKMPEVCGSTAHTKVQLPHPKPACVTSKPNFFTCITNFLLPSTSRQPRPPGTGCTQLRGGGGAAAAHTPGGRMSPRGHGAAHLHRQAATAAGEQRLGPYTYICTVSSVAAPT